jgi:hypothetical protein
MSAEQTPKIIINDVIRYFDVMFQNTGKGLLSFETVEKILETQAFFPNLEFENAAYLWMQSRDKGFMPDTVARWSTFKNKGYTIELGNQALRLREWSPNINKFIDRSFFDISQTDIPLSESRRAKIRKFKITDSFAKNIYDSFAKNSGFVLEQSSNDKISINYQTKTLYFPISNELNETFNNFVTAASKLMLAPTQEKYNSFLLSKSTLEDAHMQSLLIANALYSLTGQKPHSIENNEKKNYYWGGDLIERMKKMEALAWATKTFLENAEFEKHFNIEITKQAAIEKNKYINAQPSAQNSKSPDKMTELNEETNRLAELIMAQGDILTLLEEYANGNKIEKNAGNEYKTCCVLPTHQDKTPSFSVNTSKNVFHCFGCHEHGSIITMVMKVEGLSYPKAVDALARRFNIYSKKQEIIEKYAKPKSLQEQKEDFLMRYQTEDRDKILSMSPREFKSHKYDIETQPSKEKVYRVKEVEEKPKAPEEPKQTKIISAEPVNNSINCVTYLAQERAITRYPKELRYLVGEFEGIDKDGGSFTATYSGVGFINESGGGDIRIPKTFSKEDQHKKTRSMGIKDIVMINKELVGKTNTFIVSESGWDYTAAFNQDDFKTISDNAVGIIANGTGCVEKAIEFINQHKNRDTKIIVLTQADESNLRFTRELLLGTGVINYARVEFSSEEHDKKMDINDLHLEGVNICDRFYGTFDPMASNIDMGINSNEELM